MLKDVSLPECMRVDINIYVYFTNTTNHDHCYRNQDLDPFLSEYERL